ncbi:MAG: hypothetical protein NZ937_00735 [Armatimonadetes bacterium]|nr:hypothetical protein [Armatimonadota bacterium]
MLTKHPPDRKANIESAPHCPLSHTICHLNDYEPHSYNDPLLLALFFESHKRIAYFTTAVNLWQT